jgi:hypothetical protein
MNRVILEVSLKPFRDISDEAIQQVCDKAVRQWLPLIDKAEAVAFLMWTSDGSEILEYNGSLDDEFEWAKYIGNANKPAPDGSSPMERLHSNRWLYMENPPVMTYERLQFIVSSLKQAVTKLADKPVTVGATFDPGPEFAESKFKYERHRELSVGNTMGEGRWVHCAAVLNEDSQSYAGFPEGIPAGTTLGTFLGRQSQHFLTDLGYDYIWFSNGFGYSLSSWSVTGEVFDGDTFDTEQAPHVRESILKFWKDFRGECPDFPIETRGSNLSTGMDLSSDASPMIDIYRGDFNLTCPPNSPWAAINSDYGLELVGWLSHIAELPDGSGIPFRYYIHDPWWLNSPWLDRYEREPHDIYLPMAVSRINEAGTVDPLASVSLLTIDDSYGQMPDVVPIEVTPHISRALDDYPDAAGLVTWIYPFDEYHDWTFGTPNRVNEVFFGDWFMRAAVNQGFPLSGVVSTRNFLKARTVNAPAFDNTILVCPAPDEGSPLADALVEHLENGGRVLLYGPIKYADKRLLALLNLKATDGISGELKLSTILQSDQLGKGELPNKIDLREKLSGGGVDAVAANPAEGSSIVAEVSNHTERRVFAAFKPVPNGGQIGWVRGAFCETVTTESALPLRDNPEDNFSSEVIMRWILEKFDTMIRFEKLDATIPDPLILASRCRNGLYFSAFTTSTNTRLQWRFPHGVPIPVGGNVLVADGTGTMTMPRAWHRECRVFVQQSEASEVSCIERYSGEIGITRRLLVRGLKNADVVFYADTSNPDYSLRFQLNNAYPGKGTVLPAEEIEPGCFKVSGISEEILISW